MTYLVKNLATKPRAVAGQEHEQTPASLICVSGAGSAYVRYEHAWMLINKLSVLCSTSILAIYEFSPCYYYYMIT